MEKEQLTKHERKELKLKERKEERLKEHEEKKRKKITGKYVSWGLIALVVLFLGYFLVGYLTAEKEPDTVYSIKDENAPRLQISPSSYDLGDVSVGKGIATALFDIKNVGGNDLIIDYMETSCMCTEASLVVNGSEGPKFGMKMHGTNPTSWWKRVAPGQSAQLKVYYNPRTHHDLRGPLTRVITIYSNDPKSPQTKVRIEAYQVS